MKIFYCGFHVPCSRFQEYIFMCYQKDSTDTEYVAQIVQKLREIRKTYLILLSYLGYIFHPKYAHCLHYHSSQYCLWVEIAWHYPLKTSNFISTASLHLDSFNWKGAPILVKYILTTFHSYLETHCLLIQQEWTFS